MYFMYFIRVHVFHQIGYMLGPSFSEVEIFSQTDDFGPPNIDQTNLDYDFGPLLVGPYFGPYFGGKKFKFVDTNIGPKIIQV